MQKITPLQRTEIITLFNSGVRQAEIARHFNVSQQCISYTIFPERKARNKAKERAKPYDPVKNKIKKDRYLKRLKDKLKNNQ